MAVVAVKRSRSVAVRLTPDEHAAWSAAATAAGRGRLGSWVRDQVAASLAVPTGDPADSAAGAPGVVKASGPGIGGGVLPAAQVRAQLARVGNLLNQVVRLAHTGGVDREVAERLVAAVEGARAAMAGLRRDAGGAG